MLRKEAHGPFTTAILTTLFFLTLPFLAPAADGNRQLQAAGMLELKVGSIDTATVENLLDALPGSFDASTYYVLQLDGPMTPERRAAIEAAGVILGEYLPQFAYVADMTFADPQSVGGLPFTTWLGTFQSNWKLDPALGQRIVTTPERQAVANAGLVRVAITLFDGEDSTPVADYVAGLGATVVDAGLSGTQSIIDAVMSLDEARDLTLLPAVQFIEEAPEATFRNDSNRWILQSNVSPQTPIWNQGLHGEGQIGGLIDGPPRESHCTLDDSVAIGPSHRKIVAHRGSTGSDFHGTHTAATFAGDNAPRDAYTTHDGLAYAARLSVTNLGVITSSNLQTNLQAAHNDGARVHSNSWGDDGTTAYTTWCRQIDAFSYANEDSLVLFAITNDTTLRTPENAKNCVGVGASQDTPGQANHCSGGTGPTSDGRRKPEIYAPGCNTTSASSGTTCGTTSLTGTSMACPAASGAGLLVRQYFTDGYYPTGAEVPANGLTPSAALIRGILINCAVDMTGIGGYPSNLEGWGRVLIDNALFFTGETRGLYVVDVRNANGLTTGQQATYNFNVDSSAHPLRVTVVFTEPAAAVNAANPVINNLDLEVLAPGGTLYRGNVFSGGQSATGGTADPRNNAEQVHRLTPAVGAYTVTIKGTAVNQAAQGYALVVTGDISTCSNPVVDTPPASQTVCAGDSATFSVAASGTGPLAYQWRKNTVDIPGATSSSYLIDPATTDDAASYDVVVSNGCGSVTSAAATLTVNTAPSITGQPGDQTVTEGGSAVFSVTATGAAPLSYQWRKNTVDLPGATSSSYSINPVAASDAGSYDVVVTNPCGSETSRPAVLTVKAGCDPCDTNCDGSVNGFDIQPFVEALSGGAPLTCSGCAGDTNSDGSFNAFDIQGMVECLNP